MKMKTKTSSGSNPKVRVFVNEGSVPPQEYDGGLMVFSPSRTLKFQGVDAVTINTGLQISTPANHQFLFTPRCDRWRGMRNVYLQSVHPLKFSVNVDHKGTIIDPNTLLGVLYLAPVVSMDLDIQGVKK